MGHGRLDSIPGSKSVPGIDLSPHKPSKNIGLGHRPAEINPLYVTLSGDNAMSIVHAMAPTGPAIPLRGICELKR